jgi:beta-xylosidase
MKKLFLAVLLALAAPAPLHAEDTFANPIDVLLADPFIYHEGNTYYLYGTAARDGLLVWTSDDLIHWQLRGHAYQRTRETWGRYDFWAPELFKHKGKYYLHFTARGGDNLIRRVALAEGGSPLGPFREIKGPWFATDRETIDGHVFRDTNDDLYLYTVRIGPKDNFKFHIDVRKLDADLNVTGEPTMCMTPQYEWEAGVVNEGPFVMKVKDTYLLTFSTHGYQDPNYCVGQAWSKSPMGPWEKDARGPILFRTKTVSGPGHHCFTESPDGKELLVAYHTHQFVSDPGPPRQLAIDRVKITESPNARDARDAREPRLQIGPATDTPQPLPSGAPAYVRGQSDEFDSKELDRRRWMVFSEDPTRWKFENGKLAIQTDDGDVFENRSDLSNLFLEEAPLGDFDVTTRVVIDPKQDYQQAFLTLWQDHNNFAKITFVHTHGGKRIEIGVEKDEKYQSHRHEILDATEVWLQIKRRGESIEFLSSTDGKKFVSVETQQVALRDLKVGIGACSPDAKEGTTAGFGFVRVTPAR